MVHLALLVGQLAGAVAAGLIHQNRGLHFGVAGVAGFIQKKVDEAALQPGALALVHGKACAGNFHAQLEVDDVVLLD